MERDLLVGQTIRVTTARIVFGDTAYAVANVTSVRLLAESDRWKAVALGVLLLPVALALLSGSPNAAAFVGLTAAAVFAFAALTKPRYFILLRTSGDETRAFETTKKELADQLLAAIHQAIGSR